MDIVTGTEQTPSAVWLEFDADPPSDLLALAVSIHGPALVIRAVQNVGRTGHLRDYLPHFLRFIALQAQSQQILQAES